MHPNAPRQRVSEHSLLGGRALSPARCPNASVASFHQVPADFSSQPLSVRAIWPAKLEPLSCMRRLVRTPSRACKLAKFAVPAVPTACLCSTFPSSSCHEAQGSRPGQKPHCLHSLQTSTKSVRRAGGPCLAALALCALRQAAHRVRSPLLPTTTTRFTHFTLCLAVLDRQLTAEDEGRVRVGLAR